MPSTSLLTDGYLAHYACQAVICAFVAMLLATLSRLQPTGLMRWWSVSWAAHAVYIACAGATFSFVLAGYQAEDPARVLTGIVAMTSAVVQVSTLVAGWVAERRGVSTWSRRNLTRVLVVSALFGAAVTLVLHFGADSRTRFVCKVSVRGLLVGCAYLWIGGAVLRRIALFRLIRVWLGLGFVLFGLKHVQHAYTTFFHEGAVSYETEYLLQFVDLALHIVIAAPMLLWVCLRFADRSAHQRRELERRAAMLAEQDIRLARRQRMSAIGRMAAGVAHDFNNVLSVIQSWTDILRHDSKLDELGEEGVEEIDAAAKQAGAISQQLMLFGGKQVMQSALISVRDALDEAGRRVPQLAARAYRVDAPASLPLIRGDRAMLVTALQNLLLNAVDATARDGHIQLAAAPVTLADDDARDLDLERGDYLELQLSDDGEGIPEDALQKVFDPFFTTKQHGNGLGLPSVHGFVKQCGGAMDIDSEQGKGTRIRMLLPVASESAEDVEIALPTVEIARPVPVGEALRVLVVDDERSIASHTARVLQREGFEVTMFTCPSEALAAAREMGEDLALLVTDVRMPGLSGVELTQQIAAFHPALKVVFLTGYSDDVESSDVPLRVPPSILQKPITNAALIEAVRAQQHRAVTV
ncbi:MAG: ATP-binding protein [Planctomycetota bacterium]